MTDTPRPVIDPALPEQVKALLRDPKTRLTPASSPSPPPPGLTAPMIVARAIWIPPFAFFFGVLPGGWITAFFLASLDDDDLLTKVFHWDKKAVLAMMLTPLIQITLLLTGQDPLALVLAAASFTAWTWGTLTHLKEPESQKAAREHHTHYLVEEDFDPQAKALLTRTQQAIDKIQTSTTNQADLLDKTANKIFLPEHEWEIAQSLSEHTQLRATQEAQRSANISTELRALLKPQEEALSKSINSTTQRIEALETYATKTQEADTAYQEWQILQSIPTQTARYQALLANTARNDLAIQHLTHQTQAAQQFQNSLQPPPPPDPP